MNISDAMTKHVSGESHKMHVEKTSMEFRQGTHELAPQVTEDVGSDKVWEEREDDGENVNMIRGILRKGETKKVHIQDA